MTDIERNTNSLPDGLLDCARALDDRKAEASLLLDVRGRSSITDFLYIVTGNSDPHVKALLNAAQKALKEPGEYVSVEYHPGCDWAVVDAIDFMIHIFKSEARDLYQLETLWKDAPRITITHLLES